MLYKRIYNGHEILIWIFSTAGDFWYAYSIYLFIDGKLRRERGICHSILHKFVIFQDGPEKVLLEFLTRKSKKKLRHLDYEFSINGVLLETGTIKISNILSTPKDLEKAVEEYKKTGTINEIPQPFKKVTRTLNQVIKENDEIIDNEVQILSTAGHLLLNKIKSIKIRNPIRKKNKKTNLNTAQIASKEIKTKENYLIAYLLFYISTITIPIGIALCLNFMHGYPSLMTSILIASFIPLILCLYLIGAFFVFVALPKEVIKEQIAILKMDDEERLKYEIHNAKHVTPKVVSDLEKEGVLANKKDFAELLMLLFLPPIPPIGSSTKAWVRFFTSPLITPLKVLLRIFTLYDIHIATPKRIKELKGSVKQGRKNSVRNKYRRRQLVGLPIICIAVTVLVVIGLRKVHLEYKHDRLYKTGVTALKNKELNKAEEIFQQYFQNDYSKGAKIGDLFFSEDQYIFAYKYYKQNPYISSYYKYSIAAYNSGDLDEAYGKAKFQLIARKTKDSYQKCYLWYLVGRISEKRNDFVSASEYYNNALKIYRSGNLAKEIKQRLHRINTTSDLNQTIYQSALEMFRNKQYAKAIPLFKKVYKTTSDFKIRYSALSKIGYCKVGLNDYVAAKKYFLEFLSGVNTKKTGIQSTIGSLYSIIGKGFWDEKNFEDAIKYSRKAYDFSPNDLKVRNQFAWYLIASEDRSLVRPQKALEIAAKTVTMDKKENPYYIDTLAGCYARLGEFQKAIFYQQKAVELASKNKLSGEVFEKHLQSFKNKQIPWY